MTNKTTAPPTLETLFRTAWKQLSDARIPEARDDARVLTAWAAGVPWNRFWERREAPCSEKTARKLEEGVRRRLTREPVQYITGETEFRGLMLEITPAVLIPRPDTETIVEAALKHLSERGQEERGHMRSFNKIGEAKFLKERFDPFPDRIADIGTGSGAVALTLAHERPDLEVWGTDCSPEALEVARRNRDRHGLTDRVRLVEGNLFSPLPAQLRGTWDAIVSNPPYIAQTEREELPPEIRNHEPNVALYGGPDGFDILRKLVQEAPDHLKPDGFLAIEIGSGQEAFVKQLFHDSGFSDITSEQDLQGIERVIIGRKK